jgi:hypothetical protein
MPLIIEKLNALPQDNAYDLGKAMAYYDVLNTMKSQAERFEIPLMDISLADVCLEDLFKSK